MARIPYADCQSEAERPLAERIVAERGGILHLYRMLMHSTPIAQGWLSYLTAAARAGSMGQGANALVGVPAGNTHAFSKGIGAHF